MLGHRRRRCRNIRTTVDQHLSCAELEYQTFDDTYIAGDISICTSMTGVWGVFGRVDRRFFGGVDSRFFGYVDYRV